MMLGKLVSPFLALFRRSELDRELDEELRFHLEREVEENIRRGMSPEGARRTAMVSFGGVEQIKEECRDVRGVRFLEDLWQDLRYSLRMLVKHPSFTVVAVITLALGIGANTAIFSVVYHVVLKPLPFHEPEQLVWVWGEQAARKQAPHTPADFLDYQRRNQSFAQMAAYLQYELCAGQYGATGTCGWAHRLRKLFCVAGCRAASGQKLRAGRRTGGRGAAGLAESQLLATTVWRRGQRCGSVADAEWRACHHCGRDAAGLP
jgi:hypothetical protein